MCPALRPLLAGLPLADSITLDPHKGLFLPYGTGALLVRDGEALRRAHGGGAGYLPTFPGADLYNPCEFGPELSRPYRGLRVWLPLKLFGAERFRAALSEKRALAVEAHAQLHGVAGLTLLDPPPLSLFAFHLSWPGASLEEENEATRELMERVTDRGRVMITGAQVGERYLGRVCILCFRTRPRHVAACVEDIAAETAAITARKR
jgi:aromatic-L-amino-acid decarboxylase